MKGRTQIMRNMQQEKYQTLEEDLSILLEKAKINSFLTIREILDILSEKGRALILIFLCLPFCQPLVIPGLSLPFGIVILFMGLRHAFGRRVWFPEIILERKIGADTIEKIIQKSLPLLKKMRYFIRPRMHWLCNHGVMQVANGLLIALLGILLASPLPVPFSNMVAGWSILLTSLGLLEDDGLFVILGYVGLVLTCLFFLMIFFSV